MGWRGRSRSYFVVLAVIASAVTLAGCQGRTRGAEQVQPVSQTGFMMDTVFEITAYGAGTTAEPAVAAALDEVERIEHLLSAHIATSDVARINQAAGQSAVAVSPETIGILEQAQNFAALTEGAFDVTVKPIIDLWGIGKKDNYVPTPDEIAAALGLTGFRRLAIDAAAGTVYLPQAGMGIDLGAIAKGYAVDRAAAVMREMGVTTGIINGGGNIRVLGHKPDGSDWRIGVKDPRHEGGTAAMLHLADRSVATSGDYERYFIKDSQRYHHIFDPATGEPAASGIISATVVADSAMEADILSTAVFVLGPDRGQAVIDQLAGVEVLIISSDSSFVYSSGLEGILQMFGNSDSGNNSN